MGASFVKTTMVLALEHRELLVLRLQQGCAETSICAQLLVGLTVEDLCNNIERLELSNPA